MVQEWTEYDWSDVDPQPLEESTQMIARISYSADFKAAIGYLRAVMANKEYSERSLALTTAVIDMCPAHYSVWDYRLDIVRRIGNEVFDYRKDGLCPSSPNPPPIGEDGQWLNSFTLTSPKNYQIWGYRQHLEQPDCQEWYKGEHLLVKTVLEDDPKNFHAWSHLKWVVSRSQASFRVENLLRETEDGINRDIYNNSCWSFRFFLFMTYRNAFQLAGEAAVVANQISQAPDNESAWAYLEGIYRNFGSEVEYRKEAGAIARQYPDSNRALEVLASTSFDSDESIRIYNQLCDREPIRKGLWEYKLGLLQS